MDFRGVGGRDRRRRHDTTREASLFLARRSNCQPTAVGWLNIPRLHRKLARALLVVRLIANVPDDDGSAHARTIVGGRRVLRERAALQLDESDELD